MNKADYLSAKRVLVYRLGSLGDTVAALPALHLVARTFPQAERRMLTNFPAHAKAPASAAVIGESDLIHGYMRYKSKTRNPVELGSLWWQLRTWKPDVLVYLMSIRPLASVRRDALFFRLCGIKHLIGIPTEAELSHVFDPQTKLYETEAARLTRAIRELGPIDIDDLENWDLRLTPAEEAKADQATAPLGDRPFFFAGPGTKMPAKDWGAENWAAVMRRLAERFPDHGLVVGGARDEREPFEVVRKAWKGPSVNVCGELAPRETAAVIRRARLFLGPDSGPMYLAGAVGTPCAIAYGARGLPGTWFPPGNRHRIVYHQVDCYGCLLEVCTVQKKKCMTSISVDEMYDAAVAAACNSPCIQISIV